MADNDSGLTRRTRRTEGSDSAASTDAAPTGSAPEQPNAARTASPAVLSDDRAKRVIQRAISALWLVIAVLVGRQAKLLDILTDVALYRGMSFQLGILATVVVIAVYVELRWVRPQRTGGHRPVNFAQWQERYPTAIPVATLASCVAATAWTVAFWPFWGAWTIPYLFAMLLGAGSAVDFIIV
ncbi:hypothetical protein THASP1DRAFT_28877 [Thamnocephalis sphaerospora]|uniref:Uncharacterized protein n=1 Tax=Thamnocephalis sphaerospora TaxID=78915 RepID=A0A4P9XT39_9FUNG|nr:hypothetical protein THASP1DRAFT_28877 [Thamnocephalis sphaerospora]|eukprot:RKP09324.1 hypothetical protein THASP1DRAFT_28877 [Thamnocephalis sphaerospora]